ncbi:MULTISPECIES: hypothetical protein [unclassified Microcoleus]|uniref:hypothetical protein n=1 Tax=unclassified Microcoleus TaxID=2642155 RepID=UPI002FD3049E
MSVQQLLTTGWQPESTARPNASGRLVRNGIDSTWKDGQPALPELVKLGTLTTHEN